MRAPSKKVSVTAATSVAAVTVALAGLFLLMVKGTPVSKKEVIAAYERDKQGGVDESATITPETAASSLPLSSGPSARVTVKASGTELQSSVSEGRKPGWPLKIRPAEGVYLYETEGGERISGVPVRNFEPITRRYIYHRAQPNEWGDHHYFLEERKTWSEFRFGPQGRLALTSRQYVAFGPQKEDRTITFDPPLLSSPVPWRPGQTWEGSYEGKVYGDYRGKSKVQQIRIEGRTYEVWSDTIHLTMHGEVEGQVDVDRWISPDTGLTVFEHYVASARVQAFIYSAEWKVRLKSFTPEHQ